jgi:hypothetical protein
MCSTALSSTITQMPWLPPFNDARVHVFNHRRRIWVHAAEIDSQTNATHWIKSEFFSFSKCCYLSMFELIWNELSTEWKIFYSDVSYMEKVSSPSISTVWRFQIIQLQNEGLWRDDSSMTGQLCEYESKMKEIHQELLPARKNSKFLAFPPRLCTHAGWMTTICNPHLVPQHSPYICQTSKNPNKCA